MGIAQANVAELLRHATEELDEVYEMWAWLDGELTPEMFIDYENEETEVA